MSARLQRGLRVIMTNKIYLDNSATTKVDAKVFDAMKPYLMADFGNPSSIHSTGQSARAAVDSSRKTIATFLNCESSEIVFTSGGSESDNLAIKGVVENKQHTVNSKQQKPHVITSSFEHHAVLDTIKELEKEGKVEATFIDPDKEGIIDVKDVEKAIKKNTIFVSIMYVNNEIGTVQPIREIGKMIEKKNRDRENRILFHTDAVQATSYFEMNTKQLHVDLLTVSAHKIHGPKGIGALFVKKGTKIKHQMIGGGQEQKMRAGTENVPGIVGMAKAVRIVEKDNNRITKLRNKLIKGLLIIEKSKLNGSRELRSPNNVNISFENAEGESILINLDMEGIAASSGSACTSGSLNPSHVLIAIGVPAEKSHGSIRFSFSKFTTKEEIDKVLEVMPKIIKKLREMSPIK